MDPFYEITITWMYHETSEKGSKLVQKIAWCRQAIGHYLDQYVSRSMSPYGATRPQWVYHAMQIIDRCEHLYKPRLINRCLMDRIASSVVFKVHICVGLRSVPVTYGTCDPISCPMATWDTNPCPLIPFPLKDVAEISKENVLTHYAE